MKGFSLQYEAFQHVLKIVFSKQAPQSLSQNLLVPNIFKTNFKNNQNSVTCSLINVMRLNLCLLHQLFSEKDQMCYIWLSPRQSLRKGLGGEVVYLEGE